MPNYQCEVNVYGPHGSPTSIWIEFLGGFIFPSTSNNRQIRSKWVTTKTGDRKKIPFLGRKSEHLAALDRISTLYYDAVNRAKLEPPTMGAAPVYVQGFLPDRPGIWDPHNYDKPIGDWLEDIGVIENDCRALIHCFKRSILPVIGADVGMTSIVILRLTEGLIRELARDALKYQAIGICPTDGGVPAQTPERGDTGAAPLVLGSNESDPRLPR